MVALLLGAVGLLAVVFLPEEQAVDHLAGDRPSLMTLQAEPVGAAGEGFICPAAGDRVGQLVRRDQYLV